MKFVSGISTKKMGHLETLISLDDDSLGLHCLPRFGNVLIMIHCIQIINNGHGSTTGACHRMCALCICTLRPGRYVKFHLD